MMVIDMTAELAPIINGVLALLVVAAVAVFAGPSVNWVAGHLGSFYRHRLPAGKALGMAA